MFVLGVTGLIGSGKSEVCEILNKNGFKTIDLDKIAHQIYEIDSEVYKNLLKIYGSSILKSDLQINREILGNLVFSDYEKLIELQELVWPKIDELIKIELDKLQKSKSKLVSIQTSLLFQGGWDKFCDQIWFVEASKDVIRARLTVQRGMSEQSINLRFSAQVTVLDNKERVDRVIINQGNLLNLEQIIKRHVEERED